MGSKRKEELMRDKAVKLEKSGPRWRGNAIQRKE